MNPFYSLIGLAMRAGKVVSGDENVFKSIQKGQAKLVVIAEDAAENTKKKFSDKCQYYKAPYLCFGTMAELGNSIGKHERAVLAISDNGFVKGLNKAWKNLSEVKDIE